MANLTDPLDLIRSNFSRVVDHHMFKYDESDEDTIPVDVSEEHKRESSLERKIMLYNEDNANLP